MIQIQKKAPNHAKQRQESYNQRPLLRFFLLGPFTGGCVGFSQATAAMFSWLWHGEPDFYFRGWSDVLVHFGDLVIGGGIVGAAYGIILWAFERLSRRRVRLPLSIPAVVIIAFVIATAVIEWEFRHRRIKPLLPQLMAIVVGVGISVLLSQGAPSLAAGEDRAGM